MADETIPEIYLLHVCIRQISPGIGRRLLVRGDSTLAAGGPDAATRVRVAQRQEASDRAGRTGMPRRI